MEEQESSAIHRFNTEGVLVNRRRRVGLTQAESTAQVWRDWESATATVNAGPGLMANIATAGNTSTYQPLTQASLQSMLGDLMFNNSQAQDGSYLQLVGGNVQWSDPYTVLPPIEQTPKFNFLNILKLTK